MSAWTWDAGRHAIGQKIILAAQGRQEVERRESSPLNPLRQITLTIVADLRR